MIKRVSFLKGLIVITVILHGLIGYGQSEQPNQQYIDSITPLLSQMPDDSVKVRHFTTKPAGQGTGLGLSLSYDIIKAHGGELKVASTDTDGAEFIIQLPLKEK